jgi:type I restriction enzyme M protein
MLSNPPFGVEWKKVEKAIRKEHEQQGFNGRFGPGLPRVSDGSLLFLLHLISKMRPAGGRRQPLRHRAERLATVHRRRRQRRERDPPLRAGKRSGRGHHRPADRHVLQHRHLHLCVDLSNRKPAARKGKVQLIDASGFWQKMRKSLGSKRKELSDEHIAEITRLFGEFVEVKRTANLISRIFKNEDFGYRTITVERPLRDEEGKVVLATKGKQKGKPQPDSSLRDTENVPLAKMWTPTSSAKCCPMRRMRGSTTTRPRSATRFRSTGTSMSFSRRARWPRSMPS